ncbi:hypothetical protein SKB0123_21170 [Staphylococcus capitis]|jgi:hypothetical protein|nr:hypothetical protein GCM10008141_20870 [Staphylococcus capitis]
MTQNKGVKYIMENVVNFVKKLIEEVQKLINGGSSSSDSDNTSK